MNLVDVDGQNFRDTLAGKWNSGMNWIKDRSSDFGAGVDNVLVGWDYVWNGDPFTGPTNNPGIGGLYAITLGGAWDPRANA